MTFRRLACKTIDVYRRFISSNLPRSCRFYPNCSLYTSQAIEKYGVIKGCYLGLKRILRCHPFHPGGFDPIP